MIYCISARSAIQILSMKDEYNFFLKKNLLIGLCNSSANTLLDIILFLIAPPKADLSASEVFFFIKRFIYH